MEKRILGNIGILIILFIILVLIRKQKKNKILRLIKEQNFMKLEAEIDKGSTRMLIPAYNRETIRLNSYLMQKDKKKIDRQFERLWPVRKNDLQNQDFLVKTFQHYLFEEDRQRCRKILEEMRKSISRKSVIHDADMLYNIFFEQKYDYIEEWKARMETLPNEQKVMCAYYISMQYKNKKDYEQAEKYEQLAKKLI